MKTFYEEIMFQSHTHELPDSRKKIHEVLNQAEIIHIQNVADYFFMVNTQEHWTIETDIPNMAPPFPAFWMEYVFPPFINGENGIVQSPESGVKIGILFFAREVKDNELLDAKWVLEIFLFTHGQNMPITQPVNWLFGVGADGKISHAPNGKAAFMYCLTDEQLRALDMSHEKIVEVGPGYYFLIPALLALSFLHCKNVGMVAHDPNKIPGKRAKRNQSRVRYHVLHIEPMKKVLREEGQSETTGIKHALHICRGHFKDFSKGKGLFGKYQGLYWWDSQVRGNTKHGIVNKDYDVSPVTDVTDVTGIFY